MKFMRVHTAILCLVALAACSIPSGQDVATAPVAEGDWLIEFGEHYDYDTGYMEQLRTLSPASFELFVAAMGMSEHRSQLTEEAHFVGCISALMADDCGACTQLSLRMAAEAGVDRAVLRQLLEDPSGLNPTLQLVHAYATQVSSGGNADPADVARLRELLGDEAFAELALNVVGSLIYPALRRAMGAEVSCPAPNLDF